jgi:hypothetical protein
MTDQASQAVTANPEALLLRGLDILQNGREGLTAMEPGLLDVYSTQLEDVVENLQSAALSWDLSGMEAQERQRCLLLVRSLRRQVSQFDALLNGWARYLAGWHQIRGCREHGYTAAGAPSPTPASVQLRGEL